VEVLPDASVLGNGVAIGLVRLTADVIDDDGEGCQPAAVSLDAARNAALFKNGPRPLKSKGKLTIAFLVTDDCTSARATDSADVSPGDYCHAARCITTRSIVRFQRRSETRAHRERRGAASDLG
jgi:hypothetical protein